MKLEGRVGGREPSPYCILDWIGDVGSLYLWGMVIKDSHSTSRAKSMVREISTVFWLHKRTRISSQKPLRKKNRVGEYPKD